MPRRIARRTMYEPPRIGHDQQYRATRDAAVRLRAAIEKAHASPPDTGVHPRLHMAAIEAMRTQLEDLERQLREYEARGPRPEPGRVDSASTVRCPTCGHDVEAPRGDRWLVHATGQYVPLRTVFVCPYCAGEIRITT